MNLTSYPNQERAEKTKNLILRTDVHINKLAAIAFAEAQRRGGASCRVYERAIKADNRVLVLAVTVSRLRVKRAPK